MSNSLIPPFPIVPPVWSKLRRYLNGIGTGAKTMTSFIVSFLHLNLQPQAKCLQFLNFSSANCKFHWNFPIAEGNILILTASFGFIDSKLKSNLFDKSGDLHRFLLNPPSRGLKLLNETPKCRNNYGFYNPQSLLMYVWSTPFHK